MKERKKEVEKQRRSGSREVKMNSESIEHRSYSRRIECRK